MVFEWFSWCFLVVFQGFSSVFKDLGAFEGKEPTAVCMLQLLGVVRRIYGYLKTEHAVWL